MLLATLCCCACTDCVPLQPHTAGMRPPSSAGCMPSSSSLTVCSECWVEHLMCGKFWRAASRRARIIYSSRVRQQSADSDATQKDEPVLQTAIRPAGPPRSFPSSLVQSNLLLIPTSEPWPCGARVMQTFDIICIGYIPAIPFHELTCR